VRVRGRELALALAADGCGDDPLGRLREELALARLDASLDVKLSTMKVWPRCEPPPYRPSYTRALW
jgi:hypothetical protein